MDTIRNLLLATAMLLATTGLAHASCWSEISTISLVPIGEQVEIAARSGNYLRAYQLAKNHQRRITRLFEGLLAPCATTESLSQVQRDTYRSLLNLGVGLGELQLSLLDIMSADDIMGIY